MRSFLSLALAACSPSPIATPGVDRGSEGLETAQAVDTGGVESVGGSGSETADGAALESIGSPLVRFDPQPGLMEEPCALTLSVDLGDGEIRYTLDGSDPRSSANALVYSEPIAVTRTTVVRAVALLDEVPVEPLSTGAWIFLDQVGEQQAPEGWPETWFASYGEGPYEAHYTLSGEVVDPDPAALVSALEALPVLSLVLDPAALWGREGLYDNAWEEGEAWERPVHVSLMGTDRAWAADAGLRTYGGASRTPSGSPKKSFRVIFRSEYGLGELEAPVYGDAPEAHNGFILRGTYNHSWSHWDPSQRSRAQYLRDPFARANQIALGWESSRSLFVHLFLNGVYWGVYDLAERPDAHFFAAAYGADEASLDPDGWDVLNSGEAIDGDDLAWLEALALAASDDGSDASLAALEAVVDPDALIDYMLMNFWAGNVDWPYHNWYAGRAREGGRWRFVSWDAEHTLEGASDDVTGVSDAGTPAAIWVALLRHPSFVARVAARAEEILGDGGALSGEVALARYEALAEALRPALLAESARWGSYRKDVYCYSSPPCPLYTVDEHWDTERERLRGLLPTRAETLSAQLAARGWATAPPGSH